jgi:hypothetical protein
MMIHVMRDGQQFGPYTLEDLNAYLAQGTLLPTDQAWWEGAPAWVPMDQVPGVQLPGMPAAAGIEADPMSAANPDVAVAAAADLASKAKKKIGIIVGATVGVVALVGVLFFVWPGFLKSGDDAANGGAVGTGGSANTFAAKIEPIFKKSTCYDCHDGSGGDKVKGKFDLSKQDSVMGVIEPGKPDASEIIVRLTDMADPMPPEGKGEMLSSDDISKVKAWIAAGGKF